MTLRCYLFRDPAGKDVIRWYEVRAGDGYVRIALELGVWPAANLASPDVDNFGPATYLNMLEKAGIVDSLD